MICPKVSEEWAIDLYLSAPPPPQRKFGFAAYVYRYIIFES